MSDQFGPDDDQTGATPPPPPPPPPSSTPQPLEPDLTLDTEAEVTSSAAKSGIGGRVVAGIVGVALLVGGTVFADGGATGTELPRRFAADAARLLAPGGLALVLTLDLEHADGRRPAVRLVADLHAPGRRVHLQHLGVQEVDGPLARKCAAEADLQRARLAAIVIEQDA